MFGQTHSLRAVPGPGWAPPSVRVLWRRALGLESAGETMLEQVSAKDIYIICDHITIMYIYLYRTIYIYV